MRSLGVIVLGLVLLANLVSVGIAEPVTVGVASAEAGHDPRTGRPIVTITVVGISSQEMMALTSKHVGEKMALRVNGRIIASSVIREPLVGRIQMHETRWTEEDADKVAEQASKAELIIPFKDERSK